MGFILLIAATFMTTNAELEVVRDKRGDLISVEHTGQIGIDDPIGKELRSAKKLEKLLLLGGGTVDPEWIRSRDSLRQVQIYNCELNAECFARIAELENLEYLELADCKIQFGESLEVLARPVAVHLVNCEIRDSDLGLLAVGGFFDRTEMLVFSNNPISSDGFASVFEHLQQQIVTDVWLDRTMVTDKVLPMLSRFRSLECAKLTNSRIEGKGFEALASLPKLENLYANDVRLTASQVEEFIRKSNLKHFIYDFSQISDEERKRLMEVQKRFPRR